MALDLKPGDEIITTPFTYIATAEVIALLQLQPVMVDCNPCTFTIDEHRLEAAITEKSKVILPVHLYGQAANMEAIMRIARKHKLRVIEDNAQAIGADFTYSDGTTAKLGTIGDIGCTSFFPSKNLGAYGDGGAMFTNDEELAMRLRRIANHGQSRRYYHDEIGVNSRLDSMQAAVLGVKLRHLDEYNAARRAAADYYDELLADLPNVTTPKRAKYSTHVFHQYTILIEEGRDQVAAYLAERNIAHGIYYPVPIHRQKGFLHYGFKPEQFPVTEWLTTRTLSLPMHTELDRETQAYIVENVKAALVTYK